MKQTRVCELPSTLALLLSRRLLPAAAAVPLKSTCCDINRGVASIFIYAIVTNCFIFRGPRNLALSRYGY